MELKKRPAFLSIFPLLFLLQTVTVVNKTDQLPPVTNQFNRYILI